MQEFKGKMKTHVFVCTNKKDGKSCCAELGAEKLRKELKEWVKEHPDWKKRIRINNSGCLDKCSEGIAVAIYPQDRWFTHVDRDDAEELKDVITKIMNEPEKP